MSNLPSTLWERLDSILSDVKVLQEMTLPGNPMKLLSEMETEIINLVGSLRVHEMDTDIETIAPSGLEAVAQALETAQSQLARHMTYACQEVLKGPSGIPLAYRDQAMSELVERNSRLIIAKHKVEERVAELEGDLKDMIEDRDQLLRQLHKFKQKEESLK